jgi:hypothetical protein
MKDETANSNKTVPKFVYLVLIVIFLYFFMFVIPSLLRARISSSLASYRARNRLELVSIPAEMHVIDIYNAGNITSNLCYKGGAYLLGGTNLNEKEIEEFYVKFFSDWNWRIDDRFDSPPYPYFVVFSPAKDGYGRPREGVSIRKCDEECVSSHKFAETAINEARKDYESLYLIETWLLPYEIGENLCWCCSGG